jgi:hypothetical protein
LGKHIWAKPVYRDDPTDIINIKLKSFNKHFKGWGANIFGNTKKEGEKQTLGGFGETRVV